jgi:hypothetical protein
VFSGESLLILINCTLAHNEGVEGGAIKNYAGTAKVINCTFFANDSNLGAGIYTGGYNRARTEIFNSLFADSGIGPEMQQVDGIITGDYNLSRDASAPGPHSQHYVNFRLGPLGRHGGPTETVVLLTGGPGMGVGDPERVPPDIATDQRGLPRFTNGKVDMGAFQVQGAPFEATESAAAQ